ncbi:hypothetical protein DEI92_04695 [Curtobacterium sp. MCBD17_034]|uniref:sensor histidine kinase n=1 Tax=unclassified Curtobacterium TaxID=257496 RepID=UPI000DA74CAC|nr:MULTISPECIES: histidine kinase [unclassified Curtobacterium]PZF60934.1 hypothetical protein DEI92_04695 [Curtobacterium sp. MCBD17_034]PZM40284.1 hypothetical protein DEI90_00930 [Curtobacterium sp. MCBD17_031]
MLSLARRSGPLAPPIGGAVFLTLWIIAEAGRADDVHQTVVFVAFAVAIGLSAWMPWTALGLAVVIPVLQAVSLLPRPTATTWPTYLAIAIVAGVVGSGRSDLRRYLTLPVIAVASAAAAWAMAVPSPTDTDVWGRWVGSEAGTRTDAVTLTLALVGASGIGWGIGIAVGSAWRMAAARTRLADAEVRSHASVVELRAEQERARIARDVHDSLAHSLAVVVSQAQGASALAARDGVAVQALDDIAAVSRAALADVRSLVERIQQAGPAADDGPEEIPVLVADMRDLGMDASLEHHGTARSLPADGATALYRIVQESLTNVLKHQGRSARVRVVLDWRGPGLGLVVASWGSTPAVVLDGAGSGVPGMQERARAAGGWLRAGAGEDDAFVVTAWLPTPATAEVGS